MKVYFIDKETRKIENLLGDIVTIENNSVTYIDSVRGIGSISGYDEGAIEVFVTDAILETGTILPSDTVNKSKDFLKLNDRELIEQLQKENADLMLQLVMKGVL